jgi:hypothetical protein
MSVDDGTSHIVEAFGEALDRGDKGTAKAMSAAYKSAMIQTFCIPVAVSEDADQVTFKLSNRTHAPEPPQGWSQWCLDIEDIVSVCETEMALSTVQDRYREQLKALNRELPQRYAELGNAFVARREALKTFTSAPSVELSPRKSRSARAKTSVGAEVAHA